MTTPAPDPTRQPGEFLQYLYRVAVRRALPLHNTAAFLPAPPTPDSGGRTLVLGAGKAGGAMAHAVEALWPADAPLSGLVVTRYHHTPSRPEGLVQRIEVVEAAHPVPDAAGLAAAQRMLALTQGLTDNDLVLCLISGGGSALLTLPAEGLTLDDKQRINQALLASGAAIDEMNCVRKHLSRIKGGRLAAACAPARVVTLTISDVPGDDPSVIASGPTMPDATTCADALAILDRYRIEVPAAVRSALEAGTLETPKPGDAVFAGHAVHMTATPRQALEAAAGGVLQPFEALVKGHVDWLRGQLLTSPTLAGQQLLQHFPPAAPRPAVESSTTEQLSSRELAVLRLIAQGCSNQEISEQLFISLHTVKTHASHINSKLGVERRTQAVARAKELGVLQ